MTLSIQPSLQQEITYLRDAARGVLSAYHVSPMASVRLINESENITFKVDDPAHANPFILRIYRHGYHDEAAIRSELHWMEALRLSGSVITPRIISAIDGSLTQVLTDELRQVQRHAVLFEFLTGSEPSGDKLPVSFERLGAIAARMHDHVGAWSMPAGFRRLSWDFDTMIGRDQPVWGRWQDGIGLNRDDRQLLDRAVKILEKRLAEFGQGKDRFGLIHGDLRLTNLLVEGDTTKVLDFDDCGFGWFLYDLSAALTFIEDHPEVEALEASWLKGYRASRRLSQDDLDEIPTFHLLRRLIIVAWIASHIESETAQANGAAYTQATCRTARRYLRRFI